MGGFGIGEGTVIAPDTRVQKEQEPDPDEFVFVEKEPTFDYADLQRRVQYPEIARRAGIEGKVIVKVLVARDGKPKRAFGCRFSKRNAQRCCAESSSGDHVYSRNSKRQSD